MNIMVFLRSLAELLYEVMSWIIFWPISFWRAITRPLATMRDAEAQLALPDDEQYLETVSPPVFLILAALFAQGLATELVGTDQIVQSQKGLAALVSDNTTLLILHVVVFALFPALLATRCVRLTGETLTRQNMRPFFFAQCCPAAPFALSLSLGVTASHFHSIRADLISAGLFLFAVLFYLTVQTAWFVSRFQLSPFRGFWHAGTSLALSLLVLAGVGMLFAL